MEGGNLRSVDAVLNSAWSRGGEGSSRKWSEGPE